MTDLLIITGLIALMAFGVERFSHEISRRRRLAENMARELSWEETPSRKVI